MRFTGAGVCGCFAPDTASKYWIRDLWIRVLPDFIKSDLSGFIKGISNYGFRKDLYIYMSYKDFILNKRIFSKVLKPCISLINLLSEV